MFLTDVWPTPEPVEAPPVPPGRGGGSRMLRGLVLRDLALIVACKQTKEKHIYFLVNVPSPEAFFSPKCTKYRLAAGLSNGSNGGDLG